MLCILPSTRFRPVPVYTWLVPVPGAPGELRLSPREAAAQVRHHELRVISDQHRPVRQRALSPRARTHLCPPPPPPPPLFAGGCEHSTLGKNPGAEQQGRWSLPSPCRARARVRVRARVGRNRVDGVRVQLCACIRLWQTPKPKTAKSARASSRTRTCSTARGAASTCACPALPCLPAPLRTPPAAAVMPARTVIPGMHGTRASWSCSTTPHAGRVTHTVPRD